MPGFASRIPRTRSTSNPWLPAEELTDLSAAAEERYWEAMELATCNDPKRTAAIYLLGYVAEILLKVALYKPRGHVAGDINDDTGGISPFRGARDALRSYSKSKPLGASAPVATGINFHELDLIFELLAQTRRAKGAPLNSAILGPLQSVHIPNLSDHWEEWLRYRPEKALESDLQEVLEAVDFLRANGSCL